MASQLTWFLAPLEPDPSGDPVRPPVPVLKVRQQAQAMQTVTLPGGQYALVRLRADSANVGKVTQGQTPPGLARVTLSTTWAALPQAARDFVAAQWPTVAAQMQAADTLDVLRDRLYALATGGRAPADLFQPATDRGVPEA